MRLCKCGNIRRSEISSDCAKCHAARNRKYRQADYLPRLKDPNLPPLKIRNRARSMVCLHLKRGNLTKQPCIVCGETKVHAHHENYYKPLDITWLCEKHHNDVHRYGLKPILDILASLEP